MASKHSSIFSKLEIDRQRTELAALRSKHAAQIVLSGLAGRMISSCALTNQGVNRANMHEGTTLTPARVDLKTVPKQLHNDFIADASLAALKSGGTVSDTELIEVGGQMSEASELPSYGYAVLRQEHSPSYKGPRESMYYVGCNLVQGWRLPSVGFEDDDVALLEEQLAEVDELRTSKELTMLDPVTLIQRNPLNVRHP
jgi:hypothetical protein